MNKKTALSLIFLPLLLMGIDAFATQAINDYVSQSFNIGPAYFSIFLQIILQGLTLIVIYHSLVYKKEKTYQLTLAVMLVACVLMLFLSTALIIPFQFYLITPFLIAYYGSALLYSLLSK